MQFCGKLKLLKIEHINVVLHYVFKSISLNEIVQKTKTFAPAKDVLYKVYKIL